MTKIQSENLHFWRLQMSASTLSFVHESRSTVKAPASPAVVLEDKLAAIMLIN